MNLQTPNPIDPNRLEIYSEARRGRIFVGHLCFNSKTDCFVFEYDHKYLKSKSAIPIGPDLPLKKKVHLSKKKQLFSSLEDRIPSRQNPAYAEYCKQQGISPKETNKILLLGTIGKRGPSTFIFEALYQEPPIGPMIREFRNHLGVTVRDLSAIFGVNYPTLNRLETGKSKDIYTSNLIRTLLTVPEAGLWRAKLNQRKIHSGIGRSIIKHFEETISKREGIRE